MLSLIVEQHAQEAAFLWETRRRAVSAPHYRLADLARLDQRIEAHLDGLLVAGDKGSEIAQEQLATYPGPGEAFAAAVLAFERSTSPRRIRDVLARIGDDPKVTPGLHSALGWLPLEHTADAIKPLLTTTEPALRRLAIAGFRLHRRDPGAPLRTALSEPDSSVRAQAFRAAGELALTDQRGILAAGVDDVSADCGFWAAWSLGLHATDPAASSALRSRAEQGGTHGARAAALLVRRLPLPAARDWLRSRISSKSDLRTSVVAAGCLGDPSFVPWLIELMDDVALARISADALSLMTGVHISYEKLEQADPPVSLVGPTEDPADENVAMDPDGELTWPNRVLVERWWTSRAADFAEKTRYLLGCPVTQSAGRAVLAAGYQRQRAAAAEELCLLEPEAPLFEVRARASRQRAQLRG